MTVRSVSNDDPDLDLLKRSLQEKDDEIAKNWAKLTELAKVQMENNAILKALAEERANMNEKLSALQGDTTDLANEVKKLRLADEHT